MTKILLVEDDKSLREIYGVRLQAEGYEIVAAGDGEEALALSIKERPALILSDVMMPKISGFDMLDILRSTTETKDIKVIMMTALSSEDQRQRGEKLGADRYLVKSQVGIEDVVRTVHEVLGDTPAMNQQSTPGAAPAGPVPMPQPTAPMAPSAPQAPTTLPAPTAPFSSSAPRPAGLGDRVIQPMQANDPSQTNDFAAMMNKELDGVAPPIMPIGSGGSDDTSIAAAPTPVAGSVPQPDPAATTDDSPNAPLSDDMTQDNQQLPPVAPPPADDAPSGLPTQPGAQPSNLPTPPAA